MAIYNECKIVLNLNQLVKARPCGVDLDDEHVDNIANDLRKRLTFDSGLVVIRLYGIMLKIVVDLSESSESWIYCYRYSFKTIETMR